MRFPHAHITRTHRTARLTCIISVVALGAAAARAQVYSNKSLSLDASVSIREMYDSNALLQSEGSLANKDAAVTVVIPAVTLTLKDPISVPGTLKIDASTAFNFYHEETQETHYDTALGYRFSGQNDRWSYDSSFSALIVDGDHESFRFLSSDGAPAMGAPSLRDHRDQLQLRFNDKLQYTADAWFIRGLVNVYAADYHIDQRIQAGYCNFVNRADYNGGFDLGLKVAPKLWAVAGYRFGYQTQDQILANPIHADNIYQRALVGMEGEPVAGLKFSFLVGPDFRSFTSDHLLAGMETDPRLYAEGAATWAVTRVDDLSLNIKHWTLPASGGKTLYADNCYDLGWKHAFTSQLTASLGVKALGGEWETGRRNDWVYIARAGLNYKIDRHWSLESGYECDLGRSANRNFDGRDYDRHLLWFGGRYDF